MRTVIRDASTVAGITMAAIIGIGTPSFAATGPAVGPSQNLTVVPGTPPGTTTQPTQQVCGLLSLLPGTDTPGCGSGGPGTDLGSIAGDVVGGSVTAVPNLGVGLLQGLLNGA